MKEYLELLRDINETGHLKSDRTGTGTKSVFGRQVRFNLKDGFPLVTTKKVNFSHIVAELLWFLSGSTNISELNEVGVHIWDNWADEYGNLGPIYGHQWTNWGRYRINQIEELITRLKANPDSRRHVISAWNVDDLPLDAASPKENVSFGKMCLAPCHCLFQFYVVDGTLSCQLYQRSADAILGVPYNIASYALLTHMIAEQCDLIAGEFIHTFGDLHLYLDHITPMILHEQVNREPRAKPMLVIKRKVPSIFDYVVNDFALEGYQPHPVIRAPISV